MCYPWIDHHSLLPPPTRQPAQHSIAQHSTEDTMRDVLLGLAEDVSQGIIVEWLEPADVVRLDIAYNKNRALGRALRNLLSSAVDAVRCFIFDGLRKIKMGDEATVELGFDQVSFIFI
jgi:hypothetical protein